MQSAEGRVSHYSAVVLGPKGEKLRGYDFKHRADAEDQVKVLEARGMTAEVWSMDCYNGRVGFELAAA